MKKKNSALLALSVAAVLTISQFASNALYAQTDKNEYQSSTASYFKVNPLYANAYTIDDLKEELDSQPQAATFSLKRTTANFEDVETAADYLRDAMVERTSTVSFEYAYDGTYDELQTEWQVISESIWETALSEEFSESIYDGDYLRWHYAGMETGASMSTDGTNVNLLLTYNMTYYTTAEQEAVLQEKVEEALTTMDLEGATQFEKAEAIKLFVCNSVEYDYDNLEDDTYTLKQSAYAALVNGTSVCQGYATLYYAMCKSVGMDVRVITGIGNGGPHAWNIVEIDDYFYNVDTTWQDSYGAESAEWFLKNTEDFIDHSRDPEYDTEDFNLTYPMGETSIDVTNPPSSYDEEVELETTTEKVEETTTAKVEETTTNKVEEETTTAKVEETTTAKVEETTTTKVEEPSTTKVEETTTNKVEETTTNKVEETTTTKVEEPSTTKVEETTTAKVEETTTAKIEETTTTKVEETTTAKVEETTTTKVEETTTAKVEETTTNKVEEPTTTAKVEETTTNKVEEPTTTAKVEETTTAKVEETTTVKVEETTTAKVEETTTNKVEESATEKTVQAEISGDIPTGAIVSIKLVSNTKVREDIEKILDEMASLKNQIKAYEILDINMLLGSEKVQPLNNGKVAVTLTAPESIDITKEIVVLRQEKDGKFTELVTKVEEGKIIFETEHFSTYVIVEKTSTESETTTEQTTTPNNESAKESKTGDSAPFLVMITLLVVAGTTVMTLRRKA